MLRFNGYIRGVLDHNFYDISKVTVGMYLGHDSWGNLGTAGDNSWAQPDTVGTAEALFFEDSTCYNDQSVNPLGTYCFDGWEGPRVVIRHMSMRATMAGAHGTDSSQRSVRQFEAYENTFTGPDGVSPWNMGNAYPAPMSIRGGVGVVFNNKITTINGSFAAPFGGTNFRDPGGHVNAVYGACTGSNPWDQNSNATGSHCLDQVGAGYGDLLDTYHAGGAVNVTQGNIVAWPRQVAQPTYVWNNTLNGVVSNAIGTTVNVVVGRDIINSPRPGYTPYTYPHPLTTGATTSAAAPPVPVGLTVR